MRNYGRANAYHATQVSTVSKSKLIILMYDGAIRFIKEAMARINANDIAGRGLYISKAQRIVNELENALDKSRGGEVAVSLEKSYIRINKLLTEANISGELPPLKSSLEMLNTLRSAWEEIIGGRSPAARNQSRPIPRRR